MSNEGHDIIKPGKLEPKATKNLCKTAEVKKNKHSQKTEQRHNEAQEENYKK